MRRRSIKVLDVILRKIPGVWIVEVPWLWVIPVDYDLAAATQTTGNSNWKSRERILLLTPSSCVEWCWLIFAALGFLCMC